jgi:nicotinamidase-related amidase
MIARFGTDTALLVIDVQKGVNVLNHWGGPSGRRNNPNAEATIAKVLACWRDKKLPVFYTRHDSREATSPLRVGIPSGEFIEELEPKTGEAILLKDVNSAFVGTRLEIELRRRRIHRLVLLGFFTNFCIETTARMANNLGFDSYVVHDACATTNRIGVNGEDFDPDLVHAVSIANMHREFCTVLSADSIVALLDGDLAHVSRQQGNE